MEKTKKLKILILDDEKKLTSELIGFFLDSEFEAYEANSAAEGKKIMNKYNIDLLILDVRLHGISGIDILKEVKVLYPYMEVIMISAHGDMDTVIEALRLGAFDYLRKPFRFIDIQIAIERTQKYLQLNRKLKLLETKNSLISEALGDKIKRQFIGVSAKILKVFDQAIAAANYPDANVLITGESGTGKENVARIIHFSSTRKENLFCAVNSCAITETLLESEFFGHRKGSFTGAMTDKVGFFELSNKGTLFLDEIADMSYNLQAKILRAIEEKVVLRVGDTTIIHTDFRIISATNHDIYKRVEEKKFRLDLLHRLNTLHIHIPPLRERPEDIKPLLIHFVEAFSLKLNKLNITISKDVFDLLAKYEFPGNVRELKNMVERAIILCTGNVLVINDFPIREQNSSAIPDPNDSCNLKQNDIKLVRKALLNSKFNQSAAAGMLGITRDALLRKMKKYDISVTKIES